MWVQPECLLHSKHDDTISYEKRIIAHEPRCSVYLNLDNVGVIMFILSMYNKYSTFWCELLALKRQISAIGQLYIKQNVLSSLVFVISAIGK